MSIKGFKSQQALKQKLNGFTEDQSVDQQRYVTVQEMSGRRHALDVVIQGAYEITTVPLTALPTSNIRVIRCLNHGALKNDIIRLSNGTQFSALSVPDANTIITSVELDVSPAGDTFTVWRHITPAYNSDGALNVTSGPLQIEIDGVPTVVNIDTVTPANTINIPVHDTYLTDGTQKTKITDGAGVVNTKQLGTAVTNTDVGLVVQSVIHGVTTGGGGGYVDVKVTPSGSLTTETTVVSSVLPTGAATSANQTSELTKLDTIIANTGAKTPSYQEITNLTTSAQTFTAPAGAKWCKISADGNNAQNIRVKMGGTATITSGIRMEPSRTEDFAVAGNISVIAEAGTNQIISVTFGV